MYPLPKISIITPNYNGARYLEETIVSVVSQNYPNLEYIVIDGGSGDGSVEIIKKYSHKIFYWVSERDSGMYHALQKGFSIASGEIFGWINADDKLHAKSLFVLAEIFSSIEKVNWLNGISTHFDSTGRTVLAWDAKIWHRLDFYSGNYKWIQQESTFWRRSLWEKSGACFNLNLKYAGDFDLWLRFFRHDRLYSVRTILGGFRFLPNSNQISLKNREKYNLEADRLFEGEIKTLDAIELKRLNNYKKSILVLGFLKRLKIFNSGAVEFLVKKYFYEKDLLLFFDLEYEKFRF